MTDEPTTPAGTTGPDRGGGQYAGAPSDNTSLLEVLRELREAGYTADFRPVGTDGRISCGACGREVAATELDNLFQRRLEGASDPSDMVLVVGGSCPACHERGVLVLGYGPDASEADAAVVALLP